MTTTSPAMIDELIDGLAFHWGRLPAVAAEFALWDELERMDFLMEWPIQEDALELLTEAATGGTLTVAQHRRFNDLVCTVARGRPILEKLVRASVE